LLESFLQQLSAPSKIHVICRPGPQADCHAFVIHVLEDFRHFLAQGAPAPVKTLPNVPCFVAAALKQSSLDILHADADSLEPSLFAHFLMSLGNGGQPPRVN
jgi:hypothetical protein